MQRGGELLLKLQREKGHQHSAPGDIKRETAH
jgi:hypothetical protein